MNTCVSIVGAPRVGKSTLALAMSTQAVDGSAFLAQFAYGVWRNLNLDAAIRLDAPYPCVRAFREAFYGGPEDCHNDRRAHRYAWHAISKLYMDDDPGRLIVDTLDAQPGAFRVHTGARRQIEVDAARQTLEARGDTYIVIGVRAPHRAAYEAVNDVTNVDETMTNDSTLSIWKARGRELGDHLRVCGTIR